MSYQSLRFLALPVLLAPVLVSPAFAADKEADRFLDLRLSISSTPTPEITEQVTSGAAKESYEWRGSKAHGHQLAVNATGGCLHACGGGLVGSLQLVGSDYNITPKSLLRNDGVVFGPGVTNLRYRTVGIDVAIGAAWLSSPNPEDLAVYLELTPFAGGGGASGDTSGLNTLGSPVKRNGQGWYYEYGIKGGFYLTERQVIAGITGFYAAGSGEVDIDLENGGNSTLTTDRDGFGIGFETGWRF